MKLKNQQTKRLGKAAVEAAVVLALVVGCLVWAVSQLGQTIGDSYSHVFDSSEQVAASDAERSDSVSNASQPLLTSTTSTILLQAHLNQCR